MTRTAEPCRSQTTCTPLTDTSLHSSGSNRMESPPMGEWPRNWDELTRGVGCEMCEYERPDADDYGLRIHAGRHTDAYLQRADVQRGYTVVIWRGRHITEPTELNDTEASGYWAEVLTVARALIEVYQPLKMNYETLGNSLPHLHTHLIPRFTDDPRPGQPFPLTAQQPDAKVPEEQLRSDATALRRLLNQADLGENLPPIPIDPIDPIDENLVQGSPRHGGPPTTRRPGAGPAHLRDK